MFLVINMFYNKRLQYLRERNGLTQEKISSLISLDSGTYSHYEKEELLIPIKHLNTLANYFHVSIDYLFEFTDDYCYDKSVDTIDKIKSGKRLKELRKELMLSQDKLAKILNVSRTTITEYERGTNIIATPFLYTICKKYHVSADYLLGKIDKQQ